MPSKDNAKNSNTARVASRMPLNQGIQVDMTKSLSKKTSNGSKSTQDSRKKTRVRTGCLQCKRRHVRCDEEGRPGSCDTTAAGQCAACRRLGLGCVWPVPDQADLECRSNKRSRAGSNGSHTMHSIEAFVSEESQLIHSIEDTSHLGSNQGIRVLVNAYFEEVYPCSIFSFLNKVQFYQTFEAGKAPRALLLALCASSAKYVLDDHEEKSRSWAAEAWSHTSREIGTGKMTASSLGTLILCFHLDLFNRVFGAAWMTSGIAIRLAYALRFNLVPNVSPPGTKQVSWSEGESRRRLMWAVYIIDMYVSDGFPEYSNVSSSSMRIQLPCDEDGFGSNLGYESGRLGLFEIGPNRPWVAPQIHPRSSSTPLTQYIVLFSIRNMILSYLRKRAMEDDLPWQENSTARRCEQALSWWKIQLPPELDFVNRDWSLPTSTAEMSALLALQLWYSLSYCDLGRLTIYTFVESAPPELLLTAPQSYINETQDRCVEHATEILEICKLALGHRSNFVSRDPYIAACLYQATRIVLWDLFRHPSPSQSMKRYVADMCVPAVILLYRMAGLFSYSGCVMEDTFRLFRRYGLLNVMSARLPSDIAAALRKPDRQFKPGPAMFLDASEQSALRPSPEPPGVDELAFMPDQGQSELFRPPFHSHKDVRINLAASDSSVSPSNDMSVSPARHWNMKASSTGGTIADRANKPGMKVSNQFVTPASAIGPVTPSENFESMAPPSAEVIDPGHTSYDMSNSMNAVVGVTPGLFGSDQYDYQDSDWWGDMHWLSGADSLFTPCPARPTDQDVTLE